MSHNPEDNQASGVFAPRPVNPPTPLGYEPPRPPWWEDLFEVPSGNSSDREVWTWWQKRRCTYNVLVFCSLVISLVLYLFFLLNSAVLDPGEDAIEPFAIFLAPIFLPPLINICYTLGHVAELIWRAVSRRQTREAGRVLMAVGVGFSLLVTSLPARMWGVFWFWHLITR